MSPHSDTLFCIMGMCQQRLLPFITLYTGLYGELVYVGLSSLVLTVMEVANLFSQLKTKITTKEWLLFILQVSNNVSYVI
jgi:hypothetical protein